MVDVKAVEPLPRPVNARGRIRPKPRLKDMILVNNSRLSVQPVTEEEWAIVREMGGM